MLYPCTCFYMLSLHVFFPLYTYISEFDFIFTLTTGVDLLVDQPMTTESLMSLVELIRFETLTPRFSATVPPCWVEVQQEQQQRRHPQHLHQQHHGDAAQHTRTWKLQSDRYY